MKRLLLIICLLVSSCASHIEVRSQFCGKEGEWLNEFGVVEDFSDQKGFDESFMIVGGTGAKQLDLRSLLKERGIRCDRLTSLMMNIESDWFDGLLSFLPLVVFKKVRLRGTYYIEEEVDKNDSRDDS